MTEEKRWRKRVPTGAKCLNLALDKGKIHKQKPKIIHNCDLYLPFQNNVHNQNTNV